MAQEYQIVLHMKTSEGFESYGKFYIGLNAAEGRRLFQTLKGSSVDVANGIILMELRTISRGLPFDVQMKYCTLAEVTENCRLITKHVFKSLNLCPPAPE